MTALPPSTDFTGASVTEAGFKTAIAAQRDFLSDILGTAGTQATALAALGALGGQWVSKTGAYTVVAGDRGKIVGCSGTFTLSLTAAATLGDGFSFAVLNYGTGVITIDPNASELIDGATTITLAAGESCLVVCAGGTALRTVGRTQTQTVKQVVSTAIAAASGTTIIPLDNTTPVNTEGTQVATLNITPAATSSTVRVSLAMQVAIESGVAVVVAVFRGSTCIGAAVMAAEQSSVANKYNAVANIDLVDNPATTSPTTYTVRVGTSNTPIGSWYVAQAYYGGATASLGGVLANNRLVLTELA